MTEISRSVNHCGCITIDHYRETERMFCQNEYWSETLRCGVHKAEMIQLRAENAIQSAKIAAEQKEKEEHKRAELERNNRIWLEHVEEINKIEHVTYVPIKALKEKGILQTRLGYAKLKDLLLITKMRNRFYVSKEKLEVFDPAKYDIITRMT